MYKFSMLVLIIIAVKGASCGDIIEPHPDCKGQTYCDLKPAGYDNYAAEIDRLIQANWIHQPYTIQVNGTKLVVQTPYLEQKFKQTKCLHKHHSCNEDMKAQYGDMETECDEETLSFPLLIFEDGELKPQRFETTGSCYCKTTIK